MMCLLFIMSFLIKFISFSLYIYQLSIIQLYKVLPFLRPMCLQICCPQVGFLSWTLSAVRACIIRHTNRSRMKPVVVSIAAFYLLNDKSFLFSHGVSTGIFMCACFRSWPWSLKHSFFLFFFSSRWWNPAVLSVITQPTASIFNLHFYPSFLLIYDLPLFSFPIPSIFPSCSSLSLWPHIVRIWSSPAAGKFSV